MKVSKQKCNNPQLALWAEELCEARHGFAKSTQEIESVGDNCEAMSGFAKLLSPKGKSWIVALLVGALRIVSSSCSE